MVRRGQANTGARRSKNPRPRLGQHFLHDSVYRARIIDALPLESRDAVVEIGAGHGAMTPLLAERARKVVAVELDPRLVEGLEQAFGSDARIRILSSDVLQVELAALCEREQISECFVFGNLPYYITSPILHHLFAQRERIRAMGLVMQREVAERLTATPGTRDYGYLTVATQLFSRPDVAMIIPPGAFAPPPKVQSALVTFRMRAAFDQWPASTCDEFLQFVKRCFAQKRKNLLNNLASRFSRSQILAALERSGQRAAARAEELSLPDLAAIYSVLESTYR